jgi:hypothetical protein
MQTVSEQEKIFAAAIYEIRLLLSGYLGSVNDGDLVVRQAAHLACALHNHALQFLQGEVIDLVTVRSAMSRADEMLGSNHVLRFAEIGVTWPES